MLSPKQDVIHNACAIQPPSQGICPSPHLRKQAGPCPAPPGFTLATTVVGGGAGTFLSRTVQNKEISDSRFMWPGSKCLGGLGQYDFLINIWN